MADIPLVPDARILAGIFEDQADVRLVSCRIISNTFTVCTFHMHCDNRLFQERFKDILVRLQTSDLSHVARLQRLAYRQLPNIVPPVLDIGDTLREDGTKVYYSVTPFYTDALPLDQVWHLLEHDQQCKLMHSIVDAVETLQVVANDLKDQKRNECSRATAVVSTPSAEHLIRSILADIEETSKLTETERGIVIEPLLEGLDRLEFSSSELKELQTHIVFCHMDLEPRNILVQQKPSSADGSLRYELVAIIDWEMAGFYPFAYERGKKDTALGSSNLSFPWYALFKQQTLHLIPEAKCHTRLMQLLWFAGEVWNKQRPRNVGVRVQAKWVVRESVHKAASARQGWVRMNGFPEPKPFSKEDQEALECLVLKELGLM